MAVDSVNETGQYRLAHPVGPMTPQRMNVPPYRLESRQSYKSAAQEMIHVFPKDRSNDAFIAAA